MEQFKLIHTTVFQRMDVKITSKYNSNSERESALVDFSILYDGQSSLEDSLISILKNGQSST
jgi:archaellum component FlaF (FlaF/FlaG flagellin family)